MDEETARRSGRQVEVAVQECASTAYGWAMEDTTGFARPVADAETTEGLGAHPVGPAATTLIQQLIPAMSTWQTARDIAATQYWIHPAMPELIENALLQLVHWRRGPALCGAAGSAHSPVSSAPGRQDFSGSCSISGAGEDSSPDPASSDGVELSSSVAESSGVSSAPLLSSSSGGAPVSAGSVEPGSVSPSTDSGSSCAIESSIEACTHSSRYS